MWGTIDGVGLWLSLVLKSAFALVGMSAYLAVLGDVPGELVAFGVLLLIIVLNVFGVRKVGRLLIVIVSITVVALVVLIGFASPCAMPELPSVIGVQLRGPRMTERRGSPGVMAQA